MVSQQKRGWMRLAFAAVACALVLALAPPQTAGWHRASPGIILSSVSTSPSLALNWTRWERPAITQATSADHAAFTAILPVLFVGLLAPLVLLLVSSAQSLPLPAAPRLASLFQRPPPAQTL